MGVHIEMQVCTENSGARESGLVDVCPGARDGWERLYVTFRWLGTWLCHAISRRVSMWRVEAAAKAATTSVSHIASDGGWAAPRRRWRVPSMLEPRRRMCPGESASSLQMRQREAGQSLSVFPLHRHVPMLIGHAQLNAEICPYIIGCQ